MMLVGLLCLALQLERVPTSPWEVLCSGRDLPTAAWADPANGFRFEGQVTFGEGEDTVQQEADFLLGGPARGRYLLHNGINKVLILQSGSKDGWVFHTEEETFETMPLTHLSPETWLRWAVCRFPWGFSEALASWDPKEKKPLPVLPGLGVGLQVELDPNGRPTLWKMDTIELEVRDWKPVRNAGLQPHRWSWNVGGDRRDELFRSIEGRVLHFDAAFRPPDTDPPQSNLSAALKPGQVQAPPGGFGLVNLPGGDWLSMPPSLTSFEKLQRGGWVQQECWLAFEANTPDAIRFYAPATKEKTNLPGFAQPVQAPSGLHLRWTCWNSSPDGDLAKSLMQTARKSKIQTTGPVFIAATPSDGRAHHRTLLLKVEPQKTRD